jgi:hypothetical protein
MTLHNRTDLTPEKHLEDASIGMGRGHRVAYTSPRLVRLDLEETAGAGGIGNDGFAGSNPPPP